MKQLQLLLSIMLAIMVVACKPGKENAGTLTIDSLLVQLDETMDALKSIDFEKIEHAKEVAEGNLRRFKPLINDSISRDKVFLMSNYAIISGEEGEEEETEKSDKKAEYTESERERYMEKEVELCIKQLKDLKHDFTKEKMNEVDFAKHLETERLKAMQVMLYIEMEKNSIDYRNLLFDSLNPLVIKFIDSLTLAQPKK